MGPKRTVVLPPAGPGPVWPRYFDGTDSNITLGGPEHKWNALFQVARVRVMGAGLHSFKPRSLEAIFGNFIPHRFTPFVTHSTGVNLTNVAADHAVYLSPMRWHSVELP